MGEPAVTGALAMALSQGLIAIIVFWAIIGGGL